LHIGPKKLIGSKLYNFPESSYRYRESKGENSESERLGLHLLPLDHYVEEQKAYETEAERTSGV
jgi:hypothetical protein